MKKKKRIKTGEERILLFNLYHNKIYQSKVIKNKKKEQKKFNIKKEMGYYSSCYLLMI